jgi:cysteine desulfuration protein SufE
VCALGPKSEERIMATEAFEDIAETFEFLGDWEDRYAHVIELGRGLAPLSDGERVAETKVQGCASQVWLVPEIAGEGPEAILTFRGDSDAMIVKGLIAVLHALYSGLTVTEVAQVNAPAELARLGLDKHLSSQRSNGVAAMVQRIREIAARVAA